MTERVISVVDKVVEEQERTRLLLEKDIEDTHNAIHQISASLGKSTPELSAFADMTLKMMFRNYQVQLSKLQSEKDAVMKELKAEWSKLQTLWSELGTPRNPSEYSAEINAFDPNGEYSSIDESKLSPKTISRFRLQVQHWTAEKEQRARAISDLSQLIAQLEAQLGEEPAVSAAGVAPFSFERINALSARFERLSSVREERANIRRAVRKDILALYELLQTVPAERIAMPEEDLSRRAMDSCEREYNRLVLLKVGKRKRE